MRRVYVKPFTLAVSTELSGELLAGSLTDAKQGTEEHPTEYTPGEALSKEGEAWDMDDDSHWDSDF